MQVVDIYKGIEMDCLAFTDDILSESGERWNQIVQLQEQQVSELMNLI